MEFILGKMAENTKANTKRIKNMEKVSIHGQTEENMMENGQMEDSTEKANIYQKLVNLEKDSGKMEKEIDGWMNKSRMECEDNNNIVIKKRQYYISYGYNS